MNDQRPDPDALLSRIQRQEEKSRRGRLKVFFGAAAGVGKTYAMLAEAQERRADGEDILVGWVETHGRAETEALLAGLEQLPRRKVEHRGTRLQEFDLDAALERRPSLILVDELAHTNVEGSRHPKRWHDVEELLDAGIDVYTTLNVQHLESLNDVVGRITGIRVWETVPDKMLEEADEVELVDLPPDDLLQRLKDGKVYIPHQAEQAVEHFFRKGNLIALRELALRRTADRVDAQMRQYRDDWSIRDVWQVKERLLVCIGVDAQAERIVRGARRLAQTLGAEWIAVYVETPKLQRLPEAKRARILATLRLAEQLGAETVTLTGYYIGESVLSYARERNASKIVLGKASTPAWRRWLFGSAVEYIVSRSADIDVLFITGETAESEVFARHRPYFLRTREFLGLAAPQDTKAWYRRLEFLWATFTVVVCTGVCALMFPYFALSNLIMVYLLGVGLVAHRHGRGPSILASVLSVISFDFFFVPPRFSFAVSDTEYLVTFAVMLSVALIISSLASSVRLQAKIASHRERRTALLYAMSRDLSATRGEEPILRAAIKHLYEVFDSPCVILLPDERGKIAYPDTKSQFGSLHGADLAIAQWVHDHGTPAGRATDTLPASDTLYWPLSGSEQTLGVIAILPTDPRRVFVPEQQRLLQLFANQIGLCLERVRLAAQAQDSLLRVEAESLRNTLLSAISHDLRTPLAAIVGAAGALSSDTWQLDEAARKELAQTIQDEAAYMSRLVNKVLEMARLESGTIALNREWQTLEELVGAALNELGSQLIHHPVVSRLPADLALIFVDGLMIQSVLVNLLENAVKYTPSGGGIEVTAEEETEGVIVSVADSGPGLAPGEEKRVFDKFYAPNEKAGTWGWGWGWQSAAPSWMSMAAGSGPSTDRQGERSFDFSSRGMRRHLGSGWKTTRKPRRMASHSLTVVVVEDEAPMRRLLKTVLAAQGYLVFQAECGRRGQIEAGTRKPDLVILDLGLPDLDGIEVIRQLRAWSRVPIIVLSARDQEAQKVAALDAGADDYLTKPFGAAELLARVRVSLRHAAMVPANDGQSDFSVGHLKVDLSSRRVSIRGQEVHLTPIEYRLLSVLVKHAGKTLTHRQLMHDVWGSARADQGHYLRIYMRQLRHKLEEEPARPRFLLTEVGVGYRLAAE